MSNSTERTRRLAGASILTALVVVLQVVATFIQPGGVSMTLALTPIVLGAAFYGPRAGAWLGGVFGIVVLVMCITGADLGGGILFGVNPLLTSALCLVKGVAAGLAAALVYRALAKRTRRWAVLFAGIASPIVNTGIFLLALALLYPDTLAAWAGAEGMTPVYYLFFGVAGVNFLLEFAVNVVLAPVVHRVLGALGQRGSAA